MDTDHSTICSALLFGGYFSSTCGKRKCVYLTLHRSRPPAAAAEFGRWTQNTFAMPDPSLLEHWAIVKEWLCTARTQLVTPRQGAEAILSQFEDFLSHNELELALDVLAEVATLSPQNHRFWDSMCQATALMKLEAKHRQFAEQWFSLRKPPTKSQA